MGWTEIGWRMDGRAVVGSGVVAGSAIGRCSLGASNTSVTTDIRSGYSIPDCSVPDLCSASNIRLMFPDSRSHRSVQIVVQISVQIGFVRLDAPHISVEVQQRLGGALHLSGMLV